LEGLLLAPPTIALTAVGTPRKRVIPSTLEVSRLDPFQPKSAADAVPPTTGIALRLIRRDVQIGGDVHNYEMVVTFKNETNTRIDDWYIEVSVPVPVIFPTPTKATVRALVKTEAGLHYYRVCCPDMAREPILSREKGELRLSHRMDKATYNEYGFGRHPGEMEHWTATARAFIKGDFVGEAILAGVGFAPDRLQNFQLASSLHLPHIGQLPGFGQAPARSSSRAIPPTLRRGGREQPEVCSSS
jgi:hypothetical protein